MVTNHDCGMMKEWKCAETECSRNDGWHTYETSESVFQGSVFHVHRHYAVVWTVIRVPNQLQNVGVSKSEKQPESCETVKVVAAGKVSGTI